MLIAILKSITTIGVCPVGDIDLREVTVEVLLIGADIW